MAVDDLSKKPLKLLVFAHIPPPHHGQSYMVQLMLEGLGGDHRQRAVREQKQEKPSDIECYHVDARVSDDLRDIGGIRIMKILRLLGFCAEAIWCRFRYGVKQLYYIPAPAKRSAIYRDWIVMFLCRPFYKRLILHWRAVGLGEWLQSARWWEKKLTMLALGKADLSIVLDKENVPDAESFAPRSTQVVPNGIPDPCPIFEEAVLPERKRRWTARVQLMQQEATTGGQVIGASPDPHIFSVLFLAHCTREKGLFDAIDAVALANQRLRHEDSPLRLRLYVAGTFVSREEEQLFQARITEPDLLLDVRLTSPDQIWATGSSDSHRAVIYCGFVQGENKSRLLAGSDCFCFPTYWPAESFGNVLIEACAFGLPIVTSNWRHLPGLIPSRAAVAVAIKDARAVAEGLISMLAESAFEDVRAHYTTGYRLPSYFAKLQKALLSVGAPA